MTEEPTRRGVLLDFMLTNNEGLVGNVKVKGSLGHGDHEIVKFSVLMTRRRMNGKLTTWDFRRADICLFKDPLGRVPLNKLLEEKGVQNSWLVFTDHLLQAQEKSIAT